MINWFYNQTQLWGSSQTTMSIPYFTPDNINSESELESSTNANLLLTIRFSASISDLYLDIQTPETTTAAGLKQLIRTHLPSDLSTHRLRLIYAGRGLEDATALTISLRLSPPPPPKANEDESAKKDKGKEPVREQPRVYIHCSIGDIILSESDLAEEAAAASTLLRKRQDGSGDEHEAKQQEERQKRQASTTTPALRGFDRLLMAGFTAAEVTALRSQFMAVQSVSRTPDTMPSGAELRELEDRWLDEGTTTGSAATGTGTGGGAGGDGDDDGSFGTGSRGAIDDMLWGTVMGFFWPMGCAMWLRREEGVWSWRKGLAVFVGVVVNAAFGTMRIMN